MNVDLLFGCQFAFKSICLTQTLFHKEMDFKIKNRSLFLWHSLYKLNDLSLSVAIWSLQNIGCFLFLSFFVTLYLSLSIYQLYHLPPAAMWTVQNISDLSLTICAEFTEFIAHTHKHIYTHETQTFVAVRH